MAVSCVCTMKKTAWFYWIFNTIFSAAYSGVALTTFYNIQHVTDNMRSDTKTETTTLRNGLLASCMLGFLIVLFFIIYSFLVLIARFFGDVKLAYGIMLGCCIHTAWFQLLAGLVLQNANDWFKDWKDVGAWSSNQYSTYQATFGLSYFLVGFYIIGFIILLFARKHMGRDNELPRTASGTPANVYLDMQKSGSMQRSVQI